LLGRLSKLGVQCRPHAVSSKSYATAPSLTPKSVTPGRLLQAKWKSPAAKASTAVGKIDPDTIADELSAPPQAPSTSPESVPSSSASSQTVLASPLGETNGQSLGLDASPTDWSKSYFGLSVEPFQKEVSEILLAPIDPLDVEIKPDGLLYLPEIKYRRVLNKAFGPGGWGLAPRSETHVGPKVVSREYALVCLGRLVAIARGEQEYFDPSGVSTATEACKSNALMRCCKDLGIASELWDPRFIREFKAKHCVEIFAEHASTKKKKKLWRRRDQPKFDYPWKE